MNELRATLRSLRRQPAVVAATALSLGIGVGTAALMFSLTYSLVHAPLQVPSPESVFRLSRDASGEAIFSFPEVEALRRASGGQATLEAHQVNEVIVRWGDEPPTPTWFEIVEPGYFEAFRLGMSLGTGFSPTAESAREVVLSHALWVRLGADPGYLGRGVQVNGEQFVVTGVGPPDFVGLLSGVPVELFFPLGAMDVVLPLSGSLTNANDRFLVVTGRVDVGSPRARLQASLRTARVEGGDPEWATQVVVGPATGMLPLVQAALRPVFALLTVMVGLVIVIACVNVSGLLLARGSERERELTTRLAIGASPLAVLRVTLLDGVVLSVPGALAGLAVGAVAMRLVAAFPLPDGVPIVLAPRLDAGAAAFSVAVAVSVSILAALVPGWWVMRRAGRSGRLAPRGARRTLWLRHLFVGGQIALVTLLLGVAALLARGVQAAASMDPGFRVDGVATLSASLDRLGYDAEQLHRAWTDVLGSVRADPLVQGAGLVLFAPMGGRADRLSVSLPGTSWEPRPVLYNVVGGGTLDVLGLDVVRGRALIDADGDGTGPVPVLLNETLAARAFAQGDPIGRPIELSGTGAASDGQVVGVVRDATYRRLGEGPTPHIYVPFGRFPRGDMIVLAQHTVPTSELLPALAESVRARHPDAVVGAGTLADAVGESTFWSRVVGTGVVAAGSGGLLLALVGLFGAVSFEAERRLRELALRRALGSSDRSTRWLLLRGVMRMTGCAIVIGLAGAVFVGGLVRALLHGVPPHDPVTLVAVPTLLMALSGLIGLWPTRRALRFDPVVLLKEI